MAAGMAVALVVKAEVLAGLGVAASAVTAEAVWVVVMVAGWVVDWAAADWGVDPSFVRNCSAEPSFACTHVWSWFRCMSVCLAGTDTHKTMCRRSLGTGSRSRARTLRSC